ncbi:MAG: Trk system potassium transporter TrkA [Oscillospiraceae bacterium]|nr:Trk system potassium transporter TrkA [Oscillospiraceae bacterium]
MNIVIVGDGKVGYNLAENLSRDLSNSVTVVDQDKDTLAETFEALDVTGVCGNGVSPLVLTKAGAAKADLFIATTDIDERNLVCCMTARKLGAKHTVARIRDPGYADELSAFRSEFGLNLIINPEQIVAGEIARHLQYPAAANIEMFARGRVMMLEIAVTPGMPITNIPVKDIARRVSSSVLIGAIRRGHDVIIPTGDNRILSGDRIFIVGKLPRVSSFCEAIGLHMNKIKNMMIVGGGRIAYYLAKQLNELGVRSKIIEIDGKRCDELSALLPDSLIIKGDGTDDRLLASENMSLMDGFASVTGMDEENLMTALLAKHAGVSNVVAKINRLGYSAVIEGMGIDRIVSPKLLTTNAILRYVRGLQNALGNTVNTLYPIADDLAEAIEFTANASTRFLEVPLRKLELIPNLLVGTIVRHGEVIIPFGSDVIRTGDAVILFTRGKRLTDLNDIFVRVRDA